MIEDVWVAAGVGVFVVALFALALLVPRKVRPTPSAEVKLDDVKARLAEVERKQIQADHDLRNVRMVVAGLATKDSVNALAVSVAEMRGEVKGLISNTAATTRGVERIEDFLMKSTADAIVSARSTEGRS
ncbi:hypothetical protein [uncultured Methylobacterium sp.]|uniref:hypothetical protein n=1 Tax=uncultured Methylobacterium sp. TaxID=157278 RepID=UPI00258D05B3|nr:hypothetical protein [uncultured Methylobacterium sp.]